MDIQPSRWIERQTDVKVELLMYLDYEIKIVKATKNCVVKAITHIVRDLIEIWLSSSVIKDITFSWNVIS